MHDTYDTSSNDNDVTPDLAQEANNESFRTDRILSLFDQSFLHPSTVEFAYGRERSYDI